MIGEKCDKQCCLLIALGFGYARSSLSKKKQLTAFLDSANERAAFAGAGAATALALAGCENEFSSRKRGRGGGGEREWEREGK